VNDSFFHQITVKQSLSFALIGALNAAVDFAVFFVSVQYLHWNVVLAQFVSYACGVCNSYLWNRTLTFARGNRPHCSEIIKFITLNGVSYGISIGALFVFRTFLWPLVVSKVIATFIAFVINFIGNKRWVFRSTIPDTMVHSGE
jgi:putative flippase GtrA